MDKQNVAYPHNGILTIKRNKVLIHGTAQMDPENIMLLRVKHQGHIRCREEANPEGQRLVFA